MSDLLVASINLSVFRNASTPPDNPLAAAVVREIVEQQIAVEPPLTYGFELAADTVDLAIPSLPSPPYDVMFFLDTDISIRLNINGQGNQIVSPGGFLTMASVNTVSLTNDIIPTGESATIAANVRYFACKAAA